MESLCCVRLLAIPWTAAYQAPPSMGFSRQEYLEWGAIAFSETNPREYQIVRTHTKETTGIQDPASPNYQQHPVQDASSKQHLNNKQNKNTNPVISRQDYHLTQPCPSEEKQRKTQHKSHPMGSLHKSLDQS